MSIDVNLSGLGDQCSAEAVDDGFFHRPFEELSGPAKFDIDLAMYAPFTPIFTRWTDLDRARCRQQFLIVVGLDVEGACTICAEVGVLHEGQFVGVDEGPANDAHVASAR